MNIHDNTDYYSLPRLEVQNLVSPESKKILDVGCAEGKMASELKERNKAEVWGIEIVQNAAQKAQEKLDKVLIGAVEKQISQLPEEYFDSIIFADVLEHLFVRKLPNIKVSIFFILICIFQVNIFRACQFLLKIGEFVGTGGSNGTNNDNRRGITDT